MKRFAVEGHREFLLFPDKTLVTRSKQMNHLRDHVLMDDATQNVQGQDHYFSQLFLGFLLVHH